MSSDFLGVSDDFMVNLNVQTTMQLPSSRESILHFCESVQKQFANMGSFYQREAGEYVLEGNREAGSYPWLEIQPHRLVAGYFNPSDLEEAYGLHQWLLERIIYYLGVSPLEVECLDVLFGFNLDFRGNRDAVVADALLGGSPLAAVVSEAGTKCIECEPTFVVAMDEDCHLQGRVSLETRSSSYQVRTGQYDEEPISVYFTVRRYPEPDKKLDLKAAFQQQCRMCEELSSQVVIPYVVQPIAAAIATH